MSNRELERNDQTSPARSAKRHRNKVGDRLGRDRHGKRARLLARAAAEFERPADPAEPHDALRRILTFLRVPLACEEKRCRRSLRCVGTHRPDERPWTVPCYDRHNAVLQPFFHKHVLPHLKQSRADEIEDKF